MTVYRDRGYIVLVAMLSRSQFAEAAHVSKPAVTKAVTAGHLVVNPDGKLDTDNPLNADYLSRRYVADATASSPSKPTPLKLVKSKPGAGKKPSGDTVSPRDGFDDMLKKAGEAVSLDTSKKRMQIQLMRSQKDRHELAIAEKKNELIPRDLVRRRYSTLDAALKTHLRDLPRRISAQITAVAISGGRSAVEAALEQEISSSLARVVEAAREQGLT